MGLETGNTIAELNPSWPLGSDPKSQGDDHLRLVKGVFANDVVSAQNGGTFVEAVSFSVSATFDVGAEFYGNIGIYGDTLAAATFGNVDGVQRVSIGWEIATAVAAIDLYDVAGDFVVRAVEVDAAGKTTVQSPLSIYTVDQWAQVDLRPGVDTAGAAYMLQAHWGVDKASFGINADNSTSIIAYDDAGVALGYRVSWENNSLDTVFGGGISSPSFVQAGTTFIGPLDNSGAVLRNTLGSDTVSFDDWGKAGIVFGQSTPTTVGVQIFNAVGSNYAVCYADVWGDATLNETERAALMDANAPRMTRRDLEILVLDLQARLDAAGI